MGYAQLPVAPYSDNGLMSLELRSSSNTTWDKTTINWANQPALDVNVLANCNTTPRGTDALFDSEKLATFLDAHKGVKLYH